MLYLSYYNVTKQNNFFLIEGTVETYQVYFVAQFCKYPQESIRFIKETIDNNNCVKWIISDLLDNDSYIERNELNKRLMHCALPFMTDKMLSYIRSGICCVLRSITLFQGFDFLLGPSKCCLKACAEVSQWTMLCENYIPNCLKNYFNKGSILEFYTRLEDLLSRPSKVHKSKQIQHVLKSKNIDVNRIDLKRYHPYIEGLEFTLTDIVIYSAIVLIINGEFQQKNIILSNFPKLSAYFSTLHQNYDLNKLTRSYFETCINYPEIPIQLLPENPNFAVPNHIKKFSSSFSPSDTTLNKLEEFLSSELIAELAKDDKHVEEWSEKPVSDLEFGIISDIMPLSRIERKSDQLKNMIRPVLHLSNKIHSIVDFCAGSGQLGVLISYMLPNHDIVLVENKEESILKAKDLALNRSNITIHQTNLDYFHQPFGLGICLHGCGFVSDLVLQKCLEQRSIFVICPCCYGSLKETSNIKYPQSKLLQSVFSYNEFITIAHFADQTQKHILKEEIGKKSMFIIDLDRSLKAQENNYKTYIYKMQPENCSPKNNVIVGIPFEML